MSEDWEENVIHVRIIESAGGFDWLAKDQIGQWLPGPRKGSVTREEAMRRAEAFYSIYPNNKVVFVGDCGVPN